jgi:peptide-methionine (S)-S-oxide reductase
MMRMTHLPLASLALPVLVACSACHPRSTGVDPAPTTSSSTAAAAPLFAAAKTHIGTDPGHAGDGTPLVPGEGHALAAFAEGCFWGSENTFRHVDGVVATAVGYAGGRASHPTYEDVSSHATGHAETVLVEFDPKRVTYEQLLRAFWDTHDPTTLNRQGPDVGDNYRSEIFFFTPEEEAQARASLTEEQKHYDRPITTHIAPIGAFWKAEGYHQQYDEKSGTESCPIPKRRGS